MLKWAILTDRTHYYGDPPLYGTHAPKRFSRKTTCVQTTGFKSSMGAEALASEERNLQE